jgi:MerR family transcriptional regulator, redox-sensitive transcriptional activator SoxR
VALDEALIPIDEVAVRSGLASSALRYYERCGLIRSGEKIGGRRHYPPAVLQRLSTIKVCQTLGFSLAEIAELLDGSHEGEAWRTLSRVRRAELRSQITELQSLLAILDTTVDCSCPALHDCPEMSPDGRLAQAVPGRGRRVDRSPRSAARTPSRLAVGAETAPAAVGPAGRTGSGRERRAQGGLDRRGGGRSG